MMSTSAETNAPVAYPLVRVNLYMAEHVIRLIDNEAIRRGVSRSEMIRRGLDPMLEKLRGAR